MAIRGRKPGTGDTKPRDARSALYKAMAELEVGEYMYLETEYDGVQHIRSRVTVNDGRKPAILHGRKFSSNLYTAINAVNPANIRYLIRIERTK
jgi:hypothetical protein